MNNVNQCGQEILDAGWTVSIYRDVLMYTATASKDELTLQSFCDNPKGALNAVAAQIMEKE
jgi:hypothetical protein